MMGKAFLEHVLDNGDDGALERYLSQLTGATCGFSEIVADGRERRDSNLRPLP
jgi:hypothetical protein